MRFHRLVVENLNSFYGTHTLDFDRDIGGASVFLIVGPTGSGKSTLLDAISLALFGQTPRLDRKTGAADRDVAHIISMGTSNSRAELDFSMREADGSRTMYKATWSIRRAHDSPDGAPQRPERSLYELKPDGQISLLVSDHRAKFFDPHFAKVLKGVEIEDFKRSVMLAQGEFSAFLHSSDSEKASILERLTNTEVYRQLGSKAAAKRREIEQDWKLKNARLGESSTAIDVDVDQLAADVTAMQSDVANRRQALESARTYLTWASDRERLSENLKGAKSRLAETRAQIKERESDFGRLETDRRLRPAVEPLSRIGESRAAKSRIDGQLQSVQAETKRLSELRVELDRAVKEAEEAVQIANRNESDLQPKIEQAEKDLAKIEERGLAVAKDAERLTQLLGEQARLSKEVADSERRISALSTERQQILENLESGGEGTIDALNTMLNDVLRPAFEACEDRRKELGELQKHVRELESSHDEQTRSNTAKRKRRAPAQAQVTRHENRLTELAGEQPEAYRTELATKVESLRRKIDALNEATRHTEAIETLQAEREDVHVIINDIRVDVESIAEEEAAIKTLEGEQRELVATRAEALRLNQQVTMLAELRGELQLGEPCPLCGSPLHPFCESDELDKIDTEARSDQSKLEGALEEARQRLRDTNLRVQQLAAHYVSRTTSLRHEESRLVSISSTLERTQKQFARCVEEAGYSPLEAYKLRESDNVAATIASFSDQHETLDAELLEIDAVRRQLEVARRKLREFDEQEGSDSNSVETELQQAKDRVRRAEEELKRAESTLSQRKADLSETLSVWNINGQITSFGDAEKLVEKARAGHAELEKLSSRAAQIAEQLTKLNAELAQRRQRGQKLSDEVKQLEAQVTATRESIDADRKGVADTLGGREASALKDELKHQRESGQKNLLHVKQQLADHDAKSADVSARAEALHQRIEELSAAETMWTETLSEVLETLEVSEEEARAQILDPDVRDSLEREKAALEERATMLELQVAQAELSIEEHTDSKPDFDGQVDSARVDEMAKELDAAVLKLGGLKEQLDRVRTAGLRQQELSAELKAIETDLERWRVVADLIGVRDGTSFKLFAQTMNLRGLVERANIRLAGLHARYSLDVPVSSSKPTLSFLIRDKYRADMARPLSTLSGGETFLVSLALALALSDYRRIDFPVETLLLDEGFGTLDRDALQMALSTLHQLHADGSRQIGIISHVESLKDMVDTRIVIQKTGQGRSQIRVEHGAAQRVS